MRKVVFIFSLLFLPFSALATGNGSVSVSPNPGEFSAQSTSFSHDTTYGSLDRNVIVILNSAGTIREWIGTPPSYDGSSIYMMTDAMSPEYLSSLGTTLSPGDYTIAQMSVGSTCCTNTQIENNTHSIAEINTFTAGYYATYSFSVSTSTGTSTSTTTSSIIGFMSPQLDFMLQLFIEALFVIMGLIAGYLVIKRFTKK